MFTNPKWILLHVLISIIKMVSPQENLCMKEYSANQALSLQAVIYLPCFQVQNVFLTHLVLTSSCFFSRCQLKSDFSANVNR